MLSLFPGIGMLDHAFEMEGFTVVRGPDVIWGGDIRRFHPPPGRFDGIIGGDPCQSHSSLANLVRAKGLEPSFPDLTPEYERVVNEARPAWFLRENVPKAPDVKPDGYSVRSFLLDNSTLCSGDGTGNEQMRRRRWWFGVDRDPYRSKWMRCRCCDDFWCALHAMHAHDCSCPAVDEPCPELRRWIDFALFVLPDAAHAVDAGHDYIDARRGGLRKQTVSRRPESNGMGGDPATTPGNHAGDPPRYSLAEMLELQGLPPDWLEHQPWTMAAKRKMIGNGVAIPMGRALARAVLKANP